MTNEETILSIVTEIRDLLKTRPSEAVGARATSGPTSSRLSGLPWATLEWPSFTDKKGKRKARTLGDSTQSGYGQSDIAWWAANYEPRPYRGAISEADTEFRAALTEADAFCKAHPLMDSKQPSAPRSSEPSQKEEPPNRQAFPTDGTPEDVPY